MTMERNDRRCMFKFISTLILCGTIYLSRVMNWLFCGTNWLYFGTKRLGTKWPEVHVSLHLGWKEWTKEAKTCEHKSSQIDCLVNCWSQRFFGRQSLLQWVSEYLFKEADKILDPSDAINQKILVVGIWPSMGMEGHGRWEGGACKKCNLPISLFHAPFVVSLCSLKIIITWQTIVGKIGNVVPVVNKINFNLQLTSMSSGNPPSFLLGKTGPPLLFVSLTLNRKGTPVLSEDIRGFIHACSTLLILSHLQLANMSLCGWSHFHTAEWC